MGLKNYNQYLYFEFGWFDEDEESRISEDWPYKISPVAELEVNRTQTKILEFQENEETYYLVDGDSLNFYQKDGLSLKTLRMLLEGSSWIGEKDPVDLNTMDKRDPGIPSIPQRKDYLFRLWEEYFGDKKMLIHEGLYLKKTKKYVALGVHQHDQKVNVFGDGIIVRNVPFETLSASKRLSIAIGKLIVDEKI